jgi:DNA polymerase III subunit epsilon
MTGIIRFLMNSLAAAVERSGDSRILRRLRPKDCFANANPGNPFIGIVIDAETTGMSPSADEVIELGMFKFEYGCDGQIYRVVDSFTAGSARRAGH